MRIIVHFDACALASSGKPLGGVAAARKDVPEQFDHYLPAQTLRSEEVLTGQPTCFIHVRHVLLAFCCHNYRRSINLCCVELKSYKRRGLL